MISQISDTSISMSIVYCGNQMTAKEILMNGRSHDDGRRMMMGGVKTN